MTSYYDRLGVDPDASTAAIRAAYRDAARRRHPDVTRREAGDGSDEPRKRLVTRGMAELNEAWAVLGDPRRRAAYDEWLASRDARNDNRPVAGSAAPWEGVADEPLTDGRAVRTFALMVAVAATIAVVALVALFTYAIFWAG